MIGEIPKRPYSTGEKVVLFIARLLTTTILCALVITIAILVFDQSVSRAEGIALADGIFLIAVTIPFTFGGLVIFGLPVTYVLARLKAENAFNYAFVGAATGALWGFIVGPNAAEFLLLSAPGGGACALIWWWLRSRNS